MTGLTRSPRQGTVCVFALSVTPMEFRMKKLLIVVFTLFGLTSCGDIEPSSAAKTGGVETAQGALVAGVGDAVLEVVQKESMPNAFGGADVFGRTRATGTVALYYAGLSGNNARFIRRDVQIQSTQTTMNSSPIMINQNSRTNYSGTFGGYNYMGSATTTRAPIFLPPNTPQDQITGVREIEVRVPLASGQNTLVVAGNRLSVLEASANQVVYRIAE